MGQLHEAGCIHNDLDARSLCLNTVSADVKLGFDVVYVVCVACACPFERVQPPRCCIELRESEGGREGGREREFTMKRLRHFAMHSRRHRLPQNHCAPATRRQGARERRMRGRPSTDEWGASNFGFSHFPTYSPGAWQDGRSDERWAAPARRFFGPGVSPGPAAVHILCTSSHLANGALGLL